MQVGEVLALQRREVTIDPTSEYWLIGIYSFGKGILHRDPKPGAELGDYRFFAIEPGDLVLSNIQAWEGAIGFASQVDAGTIGTHRFLSYVPIDGRIDANWARWFFLSEPGMELIRQAAPGTTIRNRTLAIDRFEALEIPLPRSTSSAVWFGILTRSVLDVSNLRSVGSTAKSYGNCLSKAVSTDCFPTSWPLSCPSMLWATFAEGFRRARSALPERTRFAISRLHTLAETRSVWMTRDTSRSLPLS